MRFCNFYIVTLRHIEKISSSNFIATAACIFALQKFCHCKTKLTFYFSIIYKSPNYQKEVPFCIISSSFLTAKVIKVMESLVYDIKFYMYIHSFIGIWSIVIAIFGSSKYLQIYRNPTYFQFPPRIYMRNIYNYSSAGPSRNTRLHRRWNDQNGSDFITNLRLLWRKSSGYNYVVPQWRNGGYVLHDIGTRIT